jgi:hypothetical protein
MCPVVSILLTGSSVFGMVLNWCVYVSGLHIELYELILLKLQTSVFLEAFVIRNVARNWYTEF